MPMACIGSRAPASAAKIAGRICLRSATPGSPLLRMCLWVWIRIGTKPPPRKEPCWSTTPPTPSTRQPLPIRVAPHVEVRGVGGGAVLDVEDAAAEPDDDPAADPQHRAVEVDEGGPDG